MTQARPLKIAYLCDQDPEDSHSYSGGNSRILAALRAHVGNVTVLSSGWHAAQPVRRVIEALPDSFTIRARWRAQLAMARVIARGTEAELASAQHDVVFCAYSFQSLAKLRLPATMLRAFTSDATPTIYKKSEVGSAFGSYVQLSRLIDPLIERCERQVLRQCDVIFWPSKWMQTEAGHRYDLAPERSLVVPWGANIADPGPPNDVPLQQGEPVRLLMLGRDWWGKGGPIAFETMQRLRDGGHDATLCVIGCTPPQEHCNEHVKVLGHLDKSEPAENAVMQATLREAHFLIMPSHESYGFAFCEASAYGLPSLCLDVGGIPVRDAVNGQALPAGSGPSDFAACIAQYINAPADYASLRKATRQEYETRLNWQSWGEAVRIELLRARDGAPRI
ncbi:glycosyltransferase family 4 protein [uncultured Roseovarius sp.]|uniref:glycosyltransferase family 4 protein n=1 Tax=uncultured Roseovarius sp. TaxID=293344 RepID=UPI00260FA976|nr:glycosyltransferase family 4 protein [uncultured Roseovarius sp.]